MSSTSKEGIGLLAVCGTFTGLGIISVGLRFYGRRLQKVPLKADDWIMIPALVSFACRELLPTRICRFLTTCCISRSRTWERRYAIL